MPVIEQRIRDEYRKHARIDWPNIATRKIAHVIEKSLSAYRDDVVAKLREEMRTDPLKGDEWDIARMHTNGVLLMIIKELTNDV